MTPFEAAVLQKLLHGEHPVLAALREQVPAVSVATREETGAGFFTRFTLPDEIVRAPTSSEHLRIGDVEATVDGLSHGAGFLLYVEHGVLHMLEGYSYEESWPASIDRFSLEYHDPSRTAVLTQLD